jgi:hypothetical protein
LPANIVLTWENGFENFLKEYKKRRKVRTQETLEYYKKLFKKYLEGKSLSRELIDYVINHENSWLRNVFRHYIRYLYFIRKISKDYMFITLIINLLFEGGFSEWNMPLLNLWKSLNFLRDSTE